MADLATLAIAEAVRTKTRRSWLAATSGALAVVATLLMGGMVALHASGLGYPTTESNQAGRTGAGGSPTTGGDIAMIVDGTTLLSPGGKAIPLTSIAGGTRHGFQTDDGWLLWGDGSTDADQSLWLARPDGSLLRLVAKIAGSVAVAADGRRLSWNDGSLLVFGRLGQDGVKIEYQTPVDAEVSPKAIVGDTVLLSRETSTATIEYDTWQPKRGDYRPTWSSTSHVKWIYGAGPDSNTLIGLVPAFTESSDLCLARLDPAETLIATEIACEAAQLAPGSSQGTAGVISPNGRRLAVQTDDQVTILDLTAAFARQPATTRWNAAQLGVWVDSTTMIASDQTGTLRQFRDEAPDGEPVYLPNGSGLATAAHVVPLGQLS
jgi:hypothetical protein